MGKAIQDACGSDTDSEKYCRPYIYHLGLQVSRWGFGPCIAHSTAPISDL